MFCFFNCENCLELLVLCFDFFFDVFYHLFCFFVFLFVFICLFVSISWKLQKFLIYNLENHWLFPICNWFFCFWYFLYCNTIITIIDKRRPFQNVLLLMIVLQNTSKLYFFCCNCYVRNIHHSFFINLMTLVCCFPFLFLFFIACNDFVKVVNFLCNNLQFQLFNHRWIGSAFFFLIFCKCW